MEKFVLPRIGSWQWFSSLFIMKYPGLFPHWLTDAQKTEKVDHPCQKTI